MKPHHLFKYIALLLIGASIEIGVFSSCQGKSGQLSADESKELGTIRDSLFNTVLSHHPDSAIWLIDSLETAGLSESLSNYYRSVAYHAMGQELMNEFYLAQALKSGALQAERPDLFYYGCSVLFTLRIYHNDIDGALDISTNGYELARDDKSEIGIQWAPALLSDVAYSQMMKGMAEEAEKNFSLAYMALRQRAAGTNDYKDLATWTNVSYNILDAYTTTERYDKAKAWFGLAQEAIDQLSASPKCPANIALQYRRGTRLHEAILLEANGQKNESYEAFREVVQMGHTESYVGLLDCMAFLSKTNRWKELADLMPKVDSLAQKWNIPLSLLFLKDYLVPQYNAYSKAGRLDEAKAVADRVFASVDSIEIYEQKTKMKELTVLSDAEVAEKEAVLVAKQETHFWKTVSVILAVLTAALIVAFIIYYIRIRRR